MTGFKKKHHLIRHFLPVLEQKINGNGFLKFWNSIILCAIGKKIFFSQSEKNQPLSWFLKHISIACIFLVKEIMKS